MADQTQGDGSLFAEEERVLEESQAFLARDVGLEPAGRAAFATLLRAYRKLYNQLVRLIRINDRHELHLRNSEKQLRLAMGQLRQHQEKLDFDQELVGRILDKMRTAHSFDAEGIRHLLISLDQTGGDLLFSQRRPDRVRHILLGDITGHGLPAAIIGPEVADIFHTMTQKGFGAGIILGEINHQLHRKLPTGIYLSAVMLAIDEQHRHLFAWNSGLPDGLLLRGGRVVWRIPSANLPLGVVEMSSGAMTRITGFLEPGDRLVFYTDGVTEAADAQGELFGAERLEQLLATITLEDRPLEDVMRALEDYCGGRQLADDITLVEYACPAVEPPQSDR
ncbi:MAG: serine/threonine-protein phosphatase [Magnetococcales bacterium]|nr:serine/threonine-protein phosphatase [Magnetococcales bacterium]